MPQRAAPRGPGRTPGSTPCSISATTRAFTSSYSEMRLSPPVWWLVSGRMAILRREKTHTRPPESGVGGGMRPGGPTSEAGCTLKGPRARVTRGDGAVAKRRTGEAGCGAPGRAYKGAPPTPIFRGSAQTKSAANGPPSIQSRVRDRRPKGRDGFALSQRRPGSREPGALRADALTPQKHLGFLMQDCHK